MVWQDIVISIANIVLSVSLIPQIYYGFKHKISSIKKLTSLPITLALISLVISYMTLGLYFSAAMTSLAVLGWLVLFIQSIIYKNETK